MANRPERGRKVSQTISILLIGALLLCAAALVLLAWQVRRNGAALAARDEAAAAAQRALAEQTFRLQLLDRRRSVCTRLDALWLCWSRCERPADAVVAEAAAAVEEARSLFPAELAEQLDEAASLLAAAVRHQSWRQAAVEHGRHGERVALLDREAELERALRPCLTTLRTALLDATRLA
jgi:cell division protein FtsL